jgi:uncharacterized protein (DUF1330 family)
MQEDSLSGASTHLRQSAGHEGGTSASGGIEPVEARGKVTKQLSGEVKHQIEAGFEFPSTDAVDAWYEPDAYQALIPNRDEAAYVTIVVLDTF